jgi:hypothetical protein
VIEMAAGTYTAPGGGFTIFNQSKRFTIRAAAGAGVTLSGGGTTDILRITNSPHIRIERLTFANGLSTTTAIGGAITIANAGVTFVDCTFQNNAANAPSPGHTGGGGLWIQSAARVFFESCAWIGNTSRNFGAAFVLAMDSRAYVHESTFTNNRVNLPNHLPNSSGGAIHVDNGSLRVTNSRFEGNQAGYVAGAIYALGAWTNPESTPRADLVIANSTFVDNVAVKDPSVSFPAPALAGAIHIEDQTTARIYNSRFITNTASQGGALSVYRGLLEVHDGVFLGNRATTGSLPDDGFGGTIIALSTDHVDPSTGNGTINRRPSQVTLAGAWIQGRYGSVGATARQGGCIMMGGDQNAAFGLNGVQQNGSVASNRAILYVTDSAFADCDAQGASGVPGAGGAIMASLTATTIDSSVIIRSDTESLGGAIATLDHSALSIDDSTLAANTSPIGGAIYASGGSLTISDSQLIENSAGTAGAAIASNPAAAGAYPASAITGTIQNTVISNNTGPTAISEGDLAAGPINDLRYSANTIYPNASQMFFNSIGGYANVAGLNSMVVTRNGGVPSTDKTIASNVPASNAPIAGQIVAAPRSRLATVPPGDPDPPTPSYIAAAWTGGAATLNGSPRGGTSTVETASAAGTQQLAVGGAQFTDVVGNAFVPDTTLSASPEIVSSGGASQLSWATLGGSFLDQAIDQSVAIAPAANGSVTVNPTAPRAYRTFLVAAEGGDTDGAIVDVGSSDLIFRDGFESGTLGAWSPTSTDGGDLSVTMGAALDGTRGLSALVDDTNPIHVENHTPADEGRYRVRFLFDPNGIDPGEGAGRHRVRIFLAMQEAPTRRLAAVVLRRLGGAYAIRVRVTRDDGVRVDTPFVPITNAPHAIEFSLTKSTGPGANNGTLELWIDEAPVSTLTGIDNDTAGVDFGRLGMMSVKPGASGQAFFDRFESRRYIYIGLGPEIP